MLRDLLNKNIFRDKDKKFRKKRKREEPLSLDDHNKS